MAITLKITNGDVVENDDGQFATISGIDCTKQCIAESLMIETQPNGFGAGLTSLVGRVPTDELAMQMLVNNNVGRNFNNMRILQKLPDRVPQVANEIISSSTVISLQRDQTNPRRYAYKVKIVTEAGVGLVASGQI